MRCVGGCAHLRRHARRFRGPAAAFVAARRRSDDRAGAPWSSAGRAGRRAARREIALPGDVPRSSAPAEIIHAGAPQPPVVEQEAAGLDDVDRARRDRRRGAGSRRCSAGCRAGRGRGAWWSELVRSVRCGFLSSAQGEWSRVRRLRRLGLRCGRMSHRRAVQPCSLRGDPAEDGAGRDKGVSMADTGATGGPGGAHGEDGDAARLPDARGHALGGVGAACAAWPLIDSMNPAQDMLAAGAPIDVDISQPRSRASRSSCCGARKPVFIVTAPPTS